MSNIIKKTIQEQLHKKALAAYEAELDRQKNSWRKQLRGGIPAGEAPRRIGRTPFFVIPYAAAGADTIAEADHSGCPWILFMAEDGCFAPGDLEELEKQLDGISHDWAYPDEDLYEPDSAAGSGIRCYPYLKPDASPDTLLSYFYLGGIVAVRTQAAKHSAEQIASLQPTGAAFAKKALSAKNMTVADERSSAKDGLGFLYILCLTMMQKDTPVHITKVLFHRPLYYTPETLGNMLIAEPFGGSGEYVALKEAFLKSSGRGAEWKEAADGLFYPVYENTGEKVSILIPSKDHPQILQRAVASIREKSTYANLEIIVIDNGSNAENKAEYEALAKQYDFCYCYVPMDFNFSRMCNLAAKEASGDYYLLLNDDTEVITPDWIERMLGQARLPETGAVGAKLYYPDGDLIQHCGITNMYEGPVHKLFGYSDAVSYDRGRNRGVVDLVGVTAACLMIAKEKYDAVGGFPEVLSVAYNDVDFCFSLIEKQYRNVMRNDVRLFHYESLSRGDDHQDEAKRQRLFNERMILYTRHPSFVDHDPYYNPQLTGCNQNFEAGMPHENRDLPSVTDLALMKKAPGFAPVNEALIVNSDRLNVKPYAKELNAVLIDIHAHVRGLDSADYSFKVYLKQGDAVYEVPVFRRYRPDVERVYYEQTHVELSGLAARIAGGVLPEGEYEVWVEADSLISRQKLYNKASGKLKT